MPKQASALHADGLRVNRAMCKTCIYRPGLKWDLAKLEGEIADKNMRGFFAGYRVCHTSNSTVCAGFWHRHRDKFSLGQVAQRLGFVRLVGVPK